ncbi:MAG: hypothetical protein LBP89_00235 [Helicobacteraceae bacterium]|jgi:hypothetical protein|nr:hypothetical protein [Helicobacteraceae bacterium]
MKKFFALSLLCVCSLLADKGYTRFGAFEVRTAVSKDGVTTLEVFKDKKPFQTIEAQKILRDWTNERCYVNFLFNGIYGKDDADSFGWICKSGEGAWEFSYDAEKSEFAYAGPIEWLWFSDEMKEAKDFHIGAGYITSEQAGYKKIYIFQKPSNRMVQTIEGNFSGDAGYCEGNCIAIDDYNFDGFEDFSLFGEYDAGYSTRLYFLYDPKKKEFFLSEIDGANLLFDQKTKTVTSSFEGKDLTYKIENNKLKLIKESCYAKDNEWEEDEFEHNCEYAGRFTHLISVGLKNNFELEIAINADNTKGIARYRGQKEFLDLALKQKVKNDLIFDEKYKGEITGSYALTIGEYGAVIKASYIRKKDGKRFNLETTE